ncbi:DNA gyrase subunit A [Empedobacter brevis]|uniref:DNA gyrase subunit A n=3 Tax=Empedobacter TaxID=59734 RepID=A0A511NHM7_9FLAO|nr:DNA gyrase subunit A [Empedobacter brevis]MDM1072506.1 DNA gyrase subunit A [Empedobacter brevis]QES92631.1 DNA gyrase subunit A [Empedobacter brevis]QHC84385.1 DNA gyrase subunit A [Empedobacter brevis]GEM52176.1 DNA gyrase subunit A [Empedobacter brevis NBRC 14943 = ATCC 43319]
MTEGERLIPINIEDEMKSAYIDYSMSVIVSRALPDVRDGLKPVHRRVLFGMYELGVFSNRSYKKSARIVGEVLGKFHPHGDSSVYDTMVRMAQPWSLRYLLVDGQGNYGSVDGDPPAAMRYTEARLQKISDELLADLDKETVDFQLNFDDTIQEPTVLPTRVPNLLVNGASGIAVGMATNMAPHNLTEVIDGTVAYIDNREITIDELTQHIKAPDFPTGGTIYGYDGVKQAFETGRGRVVLRAKTNFEEVHGRDCIIATEIPYQVNKADMIAKTAELVKDGKLDGISEIRDESDRKGMRIVYVLKMDAVPNVVLNKLFKYTQLQSSFSVNNIALVNGRPEQLNLKDMIYHFVEHRHEVIVRRTEYELRKAQERAHILEGYMKVIGTQDDLDRAIRIIRESATPEDARSGLMVAFELSEIQARAILDLRLRTLTGLEIDKIREEYDEIMKMINHLKDILANEDLRMQIIKDELLEVRKKYGDERRTDIDYAGGDLNIEDLIPDEKVVLTISHMGYIKRTPLTEYRKQSRGGVGNRAATTRDEDFLEYMVSASNHQYMLFFTEKGKCYWMRVYEIPEGSKTSKGRAIQNLINIEPDDKVKAYIRTHDLMDEEYVNNHYVIMVTKNGIIKKTSLEAYSRPRTNGINAITVREGDTLLEALLTDGKSQIMIASRYGKAIRFEDEKVRPMGRTASGVRGINLGDAADNEVIGMIVVSDMEKETVLVVSEQGYGKRSSIEDYRETNRGGKGVTTLNITDKTGKLIAIEAVTDEDDLMIINKSGVAIRTGLDEIRVMGRATQGVRLINLKKNDEIAAIAKVEVEEELEDEVELDENGNPIVVEDSNENNETQAEETTAENPNNE